MTEEEVKELNEQRKLKQAFLKKEVLEKGYNPQEFSAYIAELKKDGKKSSKTLKS